MKVNLGEDAQNFVTYGIKNAKENIFTDDCNITYHPAWYLIFSSHKMY